MIRISDEITEALEKSTPLVALESTIISHGLPYPQNVEIAKEIEKTVRTNGAVPATIAIIKGQVKIGLDSSDIEFLASPQSTIEKASMMDIAPTVTNRRSAATTVSATSTIAHRAGIRIFATGGIGGVHRGSSMDVSSDLHALATIPIAVVSAGPKSILDLPKTLERLETLGVLVLGYKTNECPAFYTPHSGLPLDQSASSPEEIAKTLHTRWEWGQKGILIANPPPKASSLDSATISTMIEQSMKEADANNIGGKALTPFLLSYLNKHSNGKTVDTNKALVLNNAKVAAAVAVSLCKIKQV